MTNSTLLAMTWLLIHFMFFSVEEIEALMAEGQQEEVFVPQLHAQQKLGQ